MFDEALFIIAVYCVIQETYNQLLPEGVRQRGFAPELTDAEALTIAIVGEFLGLERDKAIFEYFYKHYRAWFPELRDRTLLVRQWANLWQVEQLIWHKLVRRSGTDQADFQVLDILPIPLCDLKRCKHRHIFADDVLIDAHRHTAKGNGTRGYKNNPDLLRHRGRCHLSSPPPIFPCGR